MSRLKGFGPEFEYAVECYQYLMQRERQRHVFHNRSPDIEWREDLVKRVRVLCLCHKLSLRVKYLSIYILDLFMDNHYIVKEKLELTAICSLNIAAKVDESDNKIPKYSELFTESNQYSMEDILDMEQIILQFFDWIFVTPTPASYVDYFYTTCLPELSLNKSIENVIQTYLDKSLETRFYRFYPSLIAASALYCTRAAFNLEPVWPKRVQNITKYSFSQIQECVYELKKFELISKPLNINNSLNDSGFSDFDNL